MKVTSLLTAALLTLAPGLAFAECGGYSHGTSASMTCAAGLVWDSATRTCVGKSTS